MPFGKTRTAATYRKEIFKYRSGSEVAGNAVVDGTLVELNADGRRILESGTVMVYAGTNEKQTVTIDATGGTYVLIYSAQTTAAIAWDASAQTVQNALEALSNIGESDLVVTGPDGGPYVVEFTGALSATNVAAITATDSLTGGAGTVTIATATAGAATRAAGQKVRPAPASIAAGDVAGIVMHTTEFWTQTTPAETGLTHADDAPIAVYIKNCHFAADQLVGYTGNETAVKAAMTGAGNGRCANCTIE